MDYEISGVAQRAPRHNVPRSPLISYGTHPLKDTSLLHNLNDDTHHIDVDVGDVPLELVSIVEALVAVHTCEDDRGVFLHVVVNERPHVPVSGMRK